LPYITVAKAMCAWDILVALRYRDHGVQWLSRLQQIATVSTLKTCHIQDLQFTSYPQNVHHRLKHMLGGRT